MRAVILAAGEGKRFDVPYPKCFSSVGGIPIIDRLIEQFRHVGVRDIYVVVRASSRWYKAWWRISAILPIAVIVIGDTKTAFDSFRAAMTHISSDDSIIVILGDCVVDTFVIERLVTNLLGVLVIKYPSGEMRRGDDFLGMSIPGSCLSSFMRVSLTVDSMRHQDFFIGHAQDFPIRMLSFTTKPWVNVNKVEDVQKATAFLKAQEKGETNQAPSAD